MELSLTLYVILSGGKYFWDIVRRRVSPNCTDQKFISSKNILIYDTQTTPLVQKGKYSKSATSRLLMRNKMQLRRDFLKSWIPRDYF